MSPVAVRSRRGRPGLSIPLVLVLLTVAGLGMMAAATYRQSVTRNLAALVRGSRAVRVAEAALAEVAQRRRLEEVFRDGGLRTQLAQAFQGGSLEAGVLTPAPVAFAVDPAATRASYQADDTLEITPVQVVPLYYFPDRQAQKGVFRFLAEVAVEGGGRRIAKRIAHDFEVTLFANGPDLRFLISPAPKRRLYP